jgi:hypothetical protein
LRSLSSAWKRGVRAAYPLRVTWYCQRIEAWFRCDCLDVQAIRRGEKDPPRIVERDGHMLVILNEETIARNSGRKRYVPGKMPENTGVRPAVTSHPAALTEDLMVHRTAALQAQLADNPKIALAAVVHALVLGVFYAMSRTDSVVGIAPSGACLDRSAEGIERRRRHCRPSSGMLFGSGPFGIDCR